MMRNITNENEMKKEEQQKIIQKRNKNNTSTKAFTYMCFITQPYSLTPYRLKLYG